MLFEACLSVWHTSLKNQNWAGYANVPLQTFLLDVYLISMFVTLIFRSATLSCVVCFHIFSVLHWYRAPSLSVSCLNTDIHSYWSFSCNDCLASSRLNLTFLSVHIHTYAIIIKTCGATNSTMYLYIVICRFLFLFVCVAWDINYEKCEKGGVLREIDFIIILGGQI